jgi:hypothetical protein
MPPDNRRAGLPQSTDCLFGFRLDQFIDELADPALHLWIQGQKSSIHQA